MVQDARPVMFKTVQKLQFLIVSLLPWGWSMVYGCLQLTLEVVMNLGILDVPVEFSCSVW